MIEQRSDDLRIGVKWSTGQRTPLWDALWHRILADIAPDGRVAQPWEMAGTMPPEDERP